MILLIFWHLGRIPNSSYALKRNHSFSIIERVHPGFGNGEKQLVARGSPNDLKNAARLFFDAEGELLHSPNGPIVRDRDDTSKRAFLFYKTKREMDVLDHARTVHRPITAPEVSFWGSSIDAAKWIAWYFVPVTKWHIFPWHRNLIENHFPFSWIYFMALQKIK